jgi:hypothetical protein
MVTSEPQLLALFESCGFDFTATVRDIAVRFPTPAQFSGSSSLSLSALFLGRHHVSVAIANGDRTDSLDRVAPILAAAVAKPLTVTEYPDVK